VILPLITAALTTFNLVYQDQPIAERRAGGMLFWQALKILVYPLLSGDQRKQLDALEAAAVAPAAQ
jgi:hypothetical protein